MPSPARLAATAIETILVSEFADQSPAVFHDKLHESVGHLGPAIGIYPERESPANDDANQQITDLIVQYLGYYDLQIDPDQTVDPRVIADLAHRFRVAFYAYEKANPGTDDVWFMQVREITYPDDPTGNKSRFVARIRCWGQNAALVESQA